MARGRWRPSSSSTRRRGCSCGRPIARGSSRRRKWRRCSLTNCRRRARWRCSTRGADRRHFHRRSPRPARGSAGSRPPRRRCRSPRRCRRACGCLPRRSFPGTRCMSSPIVRRGRGPECHRSTTPRRTPTRACSTSTWGRRRRRTSRLTRSISRATSSPPARPCRSPSRRAASAPMPTGRWPWRCWRPTATTRGGRSSPCSGSRAHPPRLRSRFPDSSPACGRGGW